MVQVAADPSTAWTNGQYVVLGNTHEIHWDGTTWLAGRAPVPPPPSATGATAGSPGVFTPPGSAPPAGVMGMVFITATPSTRWVTGDYVVTGSGEETYWDGSAWRSGRSPILATSAVAGTPGTYLPAGAVPPANVGALSSVTASPTTAWTPGQYIVLDDGSQAYWDGSAWVSGHAPWDYMVWGTDSWDAQQSWE